MKAKNNNSMVSFSQGVYAVNKDESNPMNEEKMINFKFKAKLMLNKGCKLGNNTINDFQLTEKGEHFKAELLYQINPKQGYLSANKRCWCYVPINTPVGRSPQGWVTQELNLELPNLDADEYVVMS